MTCMLGHVISWIFFLLPYVGRLVDSVYDCTHLITDKVRMVCVHDLPQCMFVVLSKVVRS